MLKKIIVCVNVLLICWGAKQPHYYRPAMQDETYDMLYDRARPINEKFEDVRLDIYTFPECPQSEANLTIYDGEVTVYTEDALPHRMFREPFDLSWNCSKDKLYTMFFTNLESNRTFWIYKQFQHWLVYDIKECNLTKGENLLPYQRVAGQMDKMYHLYTVYVFEQRGPLNLTMFHKQPYDKKTLRKQTQIKSFVYHHKMIGPVAGTFFYSYL
ncbi:uncharacterized protein LOC135845476 [Planococcus citri]|uniref:uncharacterized protein LOC135845476 n=1 Tax=Planococcus citri TaxID=170843 RepID=UPI0031F7FDBD